MIRIEDNPENSVLSFLISPLTEPRGQAKFYQNLMQTNRKRRKSVHQRVSRYKNQKTTS